MDPQTTASTSTSEIPTPTHSREHKLVREFRTHWSTSTDDNELSLFSFRRFRTSHLINLRFLEDEIAKVDREIYQAGLQMGIDAQRKDLLGLRSARRDADVAPIEETITQENVRKLRRLLREYDEAILNFNNISRLQTIALSDCGRLSAIRDDITIKEMYKTRLMRVDLAPADSDPIRRALHRCLRKFWYAKRVNFPNLESLERSPMTSGVSQRYQNTITIADIMARFLFACVAGASLVFPLVILSYQERLHTRLLTISLCIIVFAIVVSLAAPASNQAVMGTAAAYAAVLSVYVSTS
ncbi:uncharacterized protein EAE98_007455 [Botrytis deweyae]|uniref:DUF6594 domain-containing protein n=1 Tax=Botrytis deweyae TaxID=2478750 RepID=A0ABQ7IHN2_9HELO|nr:uncharacterized protein EAE98_007455 [Botrytis deweyae]KAF7924404.1 hypothetical protein EAE98_007455 [Botrytis deweyae]